MTMNKLHGSADSADITPADSQFLYGYPHVPRMSEGVHDPLLASALYLADGDSGVLFVSSDSIWVNKAIARRVRERIAAATSVPPRHILISSSHLGASGNQSPRHVTKGNTFAEADRLGRIVADAIMRVFDSISFTDAAAIHCVSEDVFFQSRSMPSEPVALEELQEARSRYARLQHDGAARAEVRTAECDLFGAEETAALARAAVDGRLEKAVASCLPAEIQVIAVGPWRFVAWPGEVYVEFALLLRSQFPNAFVITLANGDLQAYFVTQEAVDRRYYEAGNAIFSSPDSPEKLVDASLKLLAQLG